MSWYPLDCRVGEGAGTTALGGGEFLHNGLPFVEVICDDVRAAAIRLEVLASDAVNGNAVITEFLAFGL